MLYSNCILLVVTTFVKQACQEQQQDVRRLEDVLLVRLCGVHLRDVGAVGSCINLRVCNLSGNYIRSFEGLSACKRLVKLDLHGNQVGFPFSSLVL